MVVATGFFDGVHTGHRVVIETLVGAAKQRCTQSVVLTFWPHPRTVLQDGAASLRLLTSLEEKKKLLYGLGVDRVEVINFTKSFSRLSAEEYLRDVLVAEYGADAIVLGYDNRIGCNRCLADDVVPLAERLGLDVIRTGPLCSGEVMVSSTKIRESIQSGDMAAASRMLGRDYSMKGVVVEGNRIGRTMGFPTANMQVYDPLKIVPSGGVYLVKVKTLGSDYFGMTNIGTRPTVTGVFSGESNSSVHRTIETNIFDFSEDIYGLDIELFFLEKIRDEVRFSGLNELKEQLDRDCKTCQSIILHSV